MVKIPNHINTTLPSVDLYIYMNIDGEFKRVKRKTWATSKTPNHIEVFDAQDNSYLIKLEKIEWFYP